MRQPPPGQSSGRRWPAPERSPAGRPGMPRWRPPFGIPHVRSSFAATPFRGPVDFAFIDAREERPAQGASRFRKQAVSGDPEYGRRRLEPQVHSVRSSRATSRAACPPSGSRSGRKSAMLAPSRSRRRRQRGEHGGEVVEGPARHRLRVVPTAGRIGRIEDVHVEVQPHRDARAAAPPRRPPGVPRRAGSRSTAAASMVNSPAGTRASSARGGGVEAGGAVPDQGGVPEPPPSARTFGQAGQALGGPSPVSTARLQVGGLAGVRGGRVR